MTLIEDFYPSYEGDIPDCGPLVRGWGIMDGADSLSSAAVRLRKFAEDLETIEYEGWQLRQSIRDDVGMLTWTGPGPRPVSPWLGRERKVSEPFEWPDAMIMADKIDNSRCPSCSNYKRFCDCDSE